MKHNNNYIFGYILTLFIFLLSPQLVAASLIFSDSFSGGYNPLYWTIYPGQFAPIATTFGIQVDPSHSTAYSSLVYTSPLPQNLFFEVDMKINGQPASDMGIFVSNSQSNQWKNIFAFGVGIGGVPNTLLLRDSNNGGPNNLSWDFSNGIHHFDIRFSGSSNSLITVIEDGITLANWVSPLGLTLDQIYFSLYGTNSEFANFRVCGDSPCTAPTPSNTPPPPSPSPTLPTTKIVVIPGMGASWNWSLITGCSPGTGDEIWTPTDSSFDLLTQKLSNAGYTVFPMYYDWRNPLNNTALKLQTLISTNTLPNEKMNVVAHSLGGLISRAYIEQTQNNAKIDSLLTVGTPHSGSVDAYLSWAGAQTQLIKNPLQRFAMEAVIHYCAITHLVNPIDALHTYAPSGRSTLPIFDYLRDKSTKSLIPVVTQFYQNGWLPNNFFVTPFYGIRVGTFVGSGEKTNKELIVSPPSAKDIINGLWKDGNPSNKITTSDGDELVLISSAQIPGADNSRVDTLNHQALISTKKGTDTILNFFSITNSDLSFDTITSEPNSGIAFITNPGTLVVEDPDGIKTSDYDGLIFDTTPKSGTYKLYITPNSDTTSYSIVQLLPNGKTIWKDYTLTGRSIQQRSVIFNPLNPEDATAQ